MKKPPINLQMYKYKVPKHAFFVILDGSDVQNPEFVSHDMGHGPEGWHAQYARWRRTVLPTLRRSVVEFWELHDGEFTQVNPWMVG